MIPILVCSIIAMTIIGERLWTLRAARIMPPDLIPRVWDLHRDQRLDRVELRHIRMSSPLGAIVAAALGNPDDRREAVQERVEQAGRKVVHDLEKYLNTLGTIAAIAPYLGLLGSVLGMIKVFSTFSAASGSGNPALLAGGLSEILVATAAGLVVAIPSLAFHRYFQGKVTELTVQMEEEAVALIDTLYAVPQESEPPA